MLGVIVVGRLSYVNTKRSNDIVYAVEANRKTIRDVILITKGLKPF